MADADIYFGRVVVLHPSGWSNLLQLMCRRRQNTLDRIRMLFSNLIHWVLVLVVGV